MATLTFEGCVAMADYIIANSNQPNGMVKTWRVECLNRKASYRMLQLMEEKYNEVKEAG
jgi:hypothetical protein